MNKLISVFGAILVLAASECTALSLVRDAESEAVITQIAKPIFSASGLSPKIDINIIQDEQINAFVLDGKNIFIHTGLISFNNDPSTIAGVIAHECGHIKDGHVIRQSDMSNSLGKASVLGVIMGIAGAVSGQPELGAATIMGTNEAATRNMIGYILTQEHEADIEASASMKKLNIPNTGLIKLLHKLDHDSRLSGYNEIPSGLRTHPLARERIDFLSRHPTYDSSKPAALLTPDMMHKFAMVSAKIYAFTHSYGATMSKYSGGTDPEVYAQSVALFRAHKLPAALAKLNQLLKAHPSNPYLHELKGQFYLENGDLKPAISSYSTAHNLEPRSTLIQLQLAMSLINDGSQSSLQQAIRLLQTAANTEPFNSMLWRQMSVAYGKHGNSFASYVALAQEASLLKNTPQKAKFLAIAKKSQSRSHDRFIKQVYDDLMQS